MPASSSFLQRWLEPVLGGWLYADSALWTVVGFLGAAIFGSRFVLQWLKSEKEKKLVVPWYFWHLSFWGSVLNLLYFLHLDKAPLILGNCFLPFLYGRNILFLRAGGEKGRGRLVFAAVAVLTLVGFLISSALGRMSSHPPHALAHAEMRNGAQAIVLGLHDKKISLPITTPDIVAFLKGYEGVKTLRLSPEGTWIDPWGQPYRIFIAEESVLIRCAGPNGVFDQGTASDRDDILVEIDRAD